MITAAPKPVSGWMMPPTSDARPIIKYAIPSTVPSTSLRALYQPLPQKATEKRIPPAIGRGNMLQLFFLPR